MKRKDTHIFCISFILATIIWYFFLSWIYNGNIDSYQGIRLWLYSSNIRHYIVSVAIYFASFFFICIFSRAFASKLEMYSSTSHNKRIANECGSNSWGGIDSDDGKENVAVSKIQYKNYLLVAIFVIFFFFYYCKWGLRDQFSENGVSNGMWDAIPMAVKVFCWILIVYVMIDLIRRKEDIGRTITLGTYVYSTFGMFLLHFVLNPYASINSDDKFAMAFWAYSSVTEGIYNVLDGLPFSIDTSVIYGHYGLFFLPLKIFGNEPYSIMIVYSVLIVVTHLIVIYYIEEFVPYNWLKIILVLASVIRTSFWGPNNLPLRTLFPILMCGFILHTAKKGEVITNKDKLLGCMIACMAVLWNLETGIAVAACFCIFAIITVWQKDGLFSKSSIITYIKTIPFLFTNVLVPILLVNVYNFANGIRRPIFRLFFYPFYPSGAIDAEWNIPQNDPIMGNHIWLYMLIFIFGCACFGLYSTVYRKVSPEADSCFLSRVLVPVSLICVMLFTLYFEEAHWGKLENYVQIVVMLFAIISSKISDIVQQLRERIEMTRSLLMAVFISAILVFSTLSAQTYTDPILIYGRYKAGAYSLLQVKKDIEVIRSEIPAETYGTGQGIALIYDMLGWTNRAKYRDSSAITVANYDSFTKMFNEAANQDSFIIGDFMDYDSEKLLPAILTTEPRFKLTKEFYINGLKYSYYVREE